MPEFRLLDGILLGRAVEPLVRVGKIGIIIFSPEELSLVVSSLSGLLKAALRIKSSEFLLFDCNHNSSAIVDFDMVFQRLMYNASTDYFLTISCGDEELFNYIYFEYRSLDMEDGLDSEDRVTPTYNENANINELQYEYNVVVGIPSEEFRRVIMHLSFFGARVYMTIRHAQVIFEVQGGGIIGLSKEDNECIIGGVKECDTFYTVFDLHHGLSLWKASCLSDSVWMFQSETLPFLLNFPVRALGNIMYYFS